METNEALFNTQALLQVDGTMIERLKALAERSPTLRFRLCLHRSTEDAVQEMIVVHCRHNYSRPNAHSVPLTYLVLEGTLRVLFFNDEGAVRSSTDLGPFVGGKPFALRIEPGHWYMPICISQQVVFFETQAGPFRRDVMNRWAPWSPAEDDAAGIAAYRRRLGLPG